MIDIYHREYLLQDHLQRLHDEASRARLLKQLRGLSASRPWLSRLLARLIHRTPHPAAA